MPGLARSVLIAGVIAAVAAGVLLLPGGGPHAGAGTASPSPSAAPTIPPPRLRTMVWGDVDCNGTLAIGDAQKTARFLVYLEIAQEPPCPRVYQGTTVNGVRRSWGDNDCTTGVSIGDAQKIARRLVHLEVTAAEGCPEIGADVSVIDEEITWDEAVQLIRDCHAAGVSQTHSRLVGLSLKDGSHRSTTEPHLDDVVYEALAARERCGDIYIVTE
ncbi:MAG: hypothetical protein Q7T33_14485 [Dehalococcoidia bacterium]|nr:hypothetical protein [Dehalococcoidia bacterium]